MTEKSSMWDGIDTSISSKRKNITNFFIWFGSWAATLVFGIIFCLLFLWLTSRLLEEPGGTYEANMAGKYVFLYGLLTSMFFWATYKVVRKWKSLFFKYSRIALIVGISLNGLVLLAGIAILGVQSTPTNGSNSACSSLDQQLGKASAAIVPIATEFGYGTAFAIDGNGTYITAYHVIEGAETVYINLTTGTKPLTLDSFSSEYDIALLKSSEPTPDHLNLTAKYSTANPVYAYGYPGNTFSGGGPSVSNGIISRILTNEDIKLNYEEAPLGLEIIQTDAAVNPGNSGGPLINKCGVVGVMSSMSDSNNLGDYGFVSEQGISYAISSNTVAEKFKLYITK